MDAPRVRVTGVRFHVLNMRTRMPFKYGIASLSALPHLLVGMEVEVNGRAGRGLAAEGLPPKWFTKDPGTTFESDLAEMISVIRRAGSGALEVGEAPSAFEWWLRLHRLQGAWGAERRLPALLTGLGTSLMERALIDAVCRSLEGTFPVLARSGAFGIRWEALHPELAGRAPERWLPAAPTERVLVRHTVGLADPLEEADIPPEERLGDGLPQSLDEGMRRYGLRCFKVKLSGESARDLDRLRRFARLIERGGLTDWLWTLDGNEQYATVAAFRDFWERFEREPELEAVRSRLALVEQPLPRAVALTEGTGRELGGWRDRPTLIIDESDGEPEDLERALSAGYGGVSHKNCKGVFRGMAKACLLRHRSETTPGVRWVLTSEDLANVGPVAMLQDLCVAACLGLSHSERNGHHYFRGLSMYPARVQDAVLRVHDDLYERSADGFATLRIREGAISTVSVLAAPFGNGVSLEDLGPETFTPLEEWSAASLGLSEGGRGGGTRR